MHSQSYLLSNEDRRRGFNKICRRISSLFIPRERLNVVEWADKYRYMAKGVSFKSLNGDVRYKSSVAPHQIEPQQAFTDPAVQATILIMASQIGGKTEMINNAIFYHIAHKPTSIIAMYPTIDSSEKFSKKKFTPSAEATPSVDSMLKSPRSRDGGNTILVKEFLGGSIFFVGANSPPSLRGASGQVLIADEIDSNEETAEGDAVELLFKRGESFPNCVKILSSTPTIQGSSAIWSWFEASDQRYWFVPCPVCNKTQKLQWKSVVWSKGNPDQTYYLCESCAAALNDKQRLEMYFNGAWNPTAPFKGIRGYHLSGIYCPWPALKGYNGRLHQMAEEHLRATKKGPAALKVWVNTFLVETWSEPGERIEAAPLLERREEYGPQKLPNEIALLSAQVDVQGDRLEVEVVGVGENEETWGVEYFKIIGNPEHDQPWDDLKAALLKSYKRKDGAELKITCAAIDHRHKGNRVRRFIRTCGLPRVYAVYGASNKQSILVRISHNKHYRMFLYSVNTDAAKDALFARLKLTDHGPRFMHYPKGHGYEEETKYFEQLTSEEARITFEKGFAKRTYHKDPSRRNEALDLRVYFLAAMDILKPSIKHIQASLVPNKPTPEPKDYALKDPQQPTTTPAQPKPTARPRRKFSMGGGFVGGWRK